MKALAAVYVAFLSLFFEYLNTTALVEVEM